jgi:RHS repeat-associated protein
VYVFGEQITATTSAGATTGITGLRFIPLPGGAQTVRTGGGSSYYFETSDLHATSVITINSTLQDPVWRQFTPYGAPRSTATGAWPDTNGYLGDPVNAADGLTAIGERQYDPVTGRFLTPDPVLEAGDPTQMGGYAYAGDNPVTHSDPTGLMLPSEGGSECGTPGAPPCDPQSTGGGGNGGGSGTATTTATPTLPPRGCNKFDCAYASAGWARTAPTPGGWKSLLAGAFSFFVGLGDMAVCSQPLACLGYKAIGGEMPSALYTNSLSSRGVDTSVNSTYTDGIALMSILTLAIGGAGAAADGVGVTANAPEDAVAAEGASSGGPVQIFRNVDAREFDSIATTGKFSTGAGQMEGKWFATQGAHAEQWGQSLSGGEGITVETRIPASLADQLYLHAGKLDGIGPTMRMGSSWIS